jgi:hypothetical protein
MGRCAIVLGLVSFSHWLLDLIVHRHDMPLLPGNLGHFPQFGFGLWRFKTASILAKLLLVVGDAWCYWLAADVVTVTVHRGHARAIASAVLIFLFGVSVLTLDVRG